MSRRRWTLRVDFEPPVIVTRGWRGGEILRAADMHPLWSSSSGGWLVDDARAADVLAAFESSGAAVVVTGMPAEPIPSAVDTVAVDTATSEPTLFDVER